jgi:three-Cys-motif partner protein
MADTVTASDDLLARVIKPHTLEKFDRHSRYCDIFKGVSYSWEGHLGYVELFAGPGLAVVEGIEVEGSPLLAAKSSTFEKLAFVEWDHSLANALEQRLRAAGFGADRALVICGDANDAGVLEKAMNFLPAPGLIYAFIDPEDIKGDWHAIEFLNSRRSAQGSASTY